MAHKRRSWIFVLILIVTAFSVYGYFARPVEFASDIKINGAYAYLAIRSGGIKILNITDPAQPDLVGYLQTRGSSERLFISNNLLYVAEGNSGITIYDLTDPAKPKFISQRDTDGYAWDIAVQWGYAYVADGRSGVKIINVKDPLVPVNLKTIIIGNQIGMHDGVISVTAASNLLFVSDSGRKSLQVIQIDQSGDAQLLKNSEYQAGAVVRDIAVRDNYLFLAVNERGLIVVSYEDLQKPKEITRQSTTGKAQSFTFQGNLGFLTDATRGLIVYDLTDINNLRKMASFATNGNAYRVALSEGYAYLANGYSGLKIIQSNPSFSLSPLTSSSPQLSISDVAKYNNYLFLAAGEKGVRVIDIAKPENPRQVSFYNTAGVVTALKLKGGALAYLADRGQGLIVLDITDPMNIKQQGKFTTTGGETNNLVLSENYAYLAEGSQGLAIVDITNTVSPTLMGVYNSPGNAVGIARLENTIYLADGSAGLRIINVAEPRIPAESGAIITPGDVRGVAVLAVNDQAGDRFNPILGDPNTRIYVYLAAGSRGIRIIEATQPKDPREVGSLELPDSTWNVTVNGDRLYVSNGTQGVKVFSLNDPLHPKQIGQLDTPGRAQSVLVEGSRLFIADTERGLRVVDQSKIDNLVEISAFDYPASVNQFDLAMPYVYILDGKQNFWVFDVSNPYELNEISSVLLPGAGKQLTLAGNIAYIAGGKDGVYTVSIQNPQQLHVIDRLPARGDANQVLISENVAYIASGSAGLRMVDVSKPDKMKEVRSISGLGDVQWVSEEKNYLYVAVQQVGIIIYKVDDPYLPVEVGRFTEFQGFRKIAIQWPYAFAVGGANGLVILDISHPVKLEKVTQIATRGDVSDLYIWENYVFLAEGQQGVQVVDITDPTRPRAFGEVTEIKNALAIRAYWQAGEAFIRAYVTDDLDGLLVFQGTKNVSPLSTGFYETEGTASGDLIRSQLSSWLSGKPAGFSIKASRTIRQVFFDVFLMGGLGLLFWVVFFAQFVLPVSSLRDRREAIVRLLFYLFRQHGPAVHVREGRVVQYPGEEIRRGPGVILTDLSSAVVLQQRNDAYPFLVNLALRPLNRVGSRFFRLFRRNVPPTEPQIRVVGPGLTFTNFRPFPYAPRYDEEIRGVVDLRPQFRSISVIHSYTKEGIEIVNNVFTVFTLGQPPDTVLVTYVGAVAPENLRVVYLVDRIPSAIGQPGDGQRVRVIERLVDELDEVDKLEIHRYAQANWSKPPTTGDLGGNPNQEKAAPYHFDPERVFAAVAARAGQSGVTTPVNWDELPTQVAVDIFREMLVEQHYDLLYPLPVRGNASAQSTRPEDDPLQNLRNNFRIRVRNQGVLAFQLAEWHIDQPPVAGQVWDENQLVLHPPRTLKTPKLLRTRGIKVILANFTDLEPVDQEVRRQLVETWRAGWQTDALKTWSEHELQAIRIRNSARAQAQRDMVFTLSQIIHADFPPEVLALRVFQALEAIATDPSTQRLLPADTINLLRSFRDWFSPVVPPNLPVLGVFKMQSEGTTPQISGAVNETPGSSPPQLPGADTSPLPGTVQAGLDPGGSPDQPPPTEGQPERE